MSDCRACVRLDGVTIESKSLFCRLPQGSPASPSILFLPYMEPIHKSEPYGYGCADDCGMLGVGRSLQESAANAQQNVDKTLAWGRENGIEFATAKTEVIHFTRRHMRVQQPTVLHGNFGISEKADLRSLGIWFIRTLTFSRHIGEMVSEAARAAARLKGLSKVHSGMTPGAAADALRTIVVPKALFGSELWYPRR
jgi:hypothetical protein